MIRLVVGFLMQLLKSLDHKFECSENALTQDDFCERIQYDGKIISIILRRDYTAGAIEFFSPDDFSQQLGFLPHKKGNTINAHFHKTIDKRITLTQEVLFVRKGKIRVDFYTPAKEHLASREIEAGDIVFLCSGGHGFKILEDTEMIEVKQGPYSGKDNDKELFRGVEDDTGL